MEYEVLSVPEEYEVVSTPDQKQKPGALDTLSDMARTVGRTGARAAESIVGLPGDIAQAVLGLGSAATGNAIPSYPEVQKALPVSLPTSNQVRQGTQALTGQALEPQGEGEAIYDDIIGDLATFLIPIKGKIPFKSAITKALGGNAASWFTKQLGGGEGAQAGAKLGFTVLSGLSGGRKALTQKMGTSFERAQDATKGNTGITQALHAESALGQQIRNPQTTIESLPHLEELHKNVTKMLTDYGKTNKEFGQNFSAYKDIENGLNQSSTVGKFLQEKVNLKNLFKNPYSKSMFLHYFNAIPTAIGTAAAGYGARESVKAIDFLRHSAQARKYYGDTIIASLKGNAPLAARSLAKIDAVADKYEKKHPFDSNGEFEVVKLG